MIILNNRNKWDAVEKTNIPKEIVSEVDKQVDIIMDTFVEDAGEEQTDALVYVVFNYDEALEVSNKYKLYESVPEINETINTSSGEWTKLVYVFGDNGNGIILFYAKEILIKNTFTPNKRYITKGIDTYVPIQLQVMMWCSIDKNIEDGIEMDYLQVFEFKKEKRTLIVEHRQEQPEFKCEIKMPYLKEYSELVGETIFVIDDKQHSTMLFASEY